MPCVATLSICPEIAVALNPTDPPAGIEAGLFPPGIEEAGLLAGIHASELPAGTEAGLFPSGIVEAGLLAGIHASELPAGTGLGLTRGPPEAVPPSVSRGP